MIYLIRRSDSQRLRINPRHIAEYHDDVESGAMLQLGNGVYHQVNEGADAIDLLIKRRPFSGFTAKRGRPARKKRGKK